MPATVRTPVRMAPVLYAPEPDTAEDFELSTIVRVLPKPSELAIHVPSIGLGAILIPAPPQLKTRNPMLRPRRCRRKDVP